MVFECTLPNCLNLSGSFLGYLIGTGLPMAFVLIGWLIGRSTHKNRKS